MEYFERIIKIFPDYKERYCVKPGLTGLARIEYKHTLTVQDSIKKFEYDMKYLNSISYWHDLQIILKTIPMIRAGNGDN